MTYVIDSDDTTRMQDVHEEVTPGPRVGIRPPQRDIVSEVLLGEYKLDS